MDVSPDRQAVTQLLRQWSSGSKQALDQLMPVVYDQLPKAGLKLSAGRTTRPHSARNGSGSRSLCAPGRLRCGVGGPRAFFCSVGPYVAPYPGRSRQVATTGKTRRRISSRFLLMKQYSLGHGATKASWSLTTRCNASRLRIRGRAS